MTRNGHFETAATLLSTSHAVAISNKFLNSQTNKITAKIEVLVGLDVVTPYNVSKVAAQKKSTILALAIITVSLTQNTRLLKLQLVGLYHTYFSFEIKKMFLKIC